MAWSRALRAADSASRTSPPSFDGDKRGRMRQFYEVVAFDQKFLWSTCRSGEHFVDACFGVVWGRKFIQRHLLLLSLVGHSQFLRILIGTDLSVTADPATGQNDSLGNVICLGLLHSGASFCQVIVSSAFIFVTFQIVITSSVGSESSSVLVSKFERHELNLVPTDGFEPWPWVGGHHG